MKCYMKDHNKNAIYTMITAGKNIYTIRQRLEGNRDNEVDTFA